MFEFLPIIDKFLASTQLRYDTSEVCRSIDEMSSSIESQSRSNVGGWQSESFALDSGFQNHRDLYDLLSISAAEIASSVFDNKVTADMSRSCGFFNKIGREHSHSRHVHTGCDLCSIMYLNSGEGFAMTNFSSDPVLLTESDLNKNAFSVYNRPFEIQTTPITGYAVFFPPHFSHAVTSHLSDQHRYTLACNWNFF